MSTIKVEVYDVEKPSEELDYHSLNAKLNLVGADGRLQLDADKEAARKFFLDEVNQKTIFFHDIEEKIDFLVENNYYEEELIELYRFDFIKKLFKKAYSYRFRFESFLGAFKYYTSYTLKTFDGKRYLERYEDRMVMNALYLANGDEKLAEDLVDELMSGTYQPATPTFLNAGKAQRGEMVSCYLLRIEDNMESISRAFNSAVQLSKRGGGVAFNLTNVREAGAPIKNIEGVGTGIVPIMKIFEDSFSWANQLGSRQGAGAVYLNAHHPDIISFLDTKRENADEKIRIKTLSIGVIIPDITFHLAKENKDMYLFSPYDVEREYGVPFSEISVTEEYENLVANPRIKKKKINARKLFAMIAEISFESGYPFLLFEDNVNRQHPNAGKVTMSNLCVTGDTRILTDYGYKRVKDLYDSQEDFKVVVDNRARKMSLSAKGVETVDSTKMFRTSKCTDIFKLKTHEGFELKATEWHKMYVVRDGELVKIPLAEVRPGDKILVQPDGGAFGAKHFPELARIVAHSLAAGEFICKSETEGIIRFDYSSSNIGITNEFAASMKRDIDYVLEQVGLAPDAATHFSAKHGNVVTSKNLFRYFNENMPDYASSVEALFDYDKETQLEFIRELMRVSFRMSVNEPWVSISFGRMSAECLRRIQTILLNIGVYSVIRTFKYSGSVVVRGSTDVNKLLDLVETVGVDISAGDLKSIRESWGEDFYLDNKRMATVKSVEFYSREACYDVTVEDGHSVIFDGISTGNCSEILQSSTASEYNPDLSYKVIGEDISCNLGSLNIAKALDKGNLAKTVDIAMRALTTVSDLSNIDTVPSIANGNAKKHAVGLGAMNLHGFLGRERIHYDSPEAVDFTNMFFYVVNYLSLVSSNKIAKERGVYFDDFKESSYYTGEYFDKYINGEWVPQTDAVRKLFEKFDVYIPTQDDWRKLAAKVRKHGLYHAYRLAIAPTGSISYCAYCTQSIMPIPAPIEARKEGKIGRVYRSAPYMTEDNIQFFKSAYAMGPEPLIDIVAAAQQHVDQGISTTLFFTDKATTRDLNKAYIEAWKKGLKTIYYCRIKPGAVAGTEVDNLANDFCESCMI